jgi:hypothetical protein
LTRRQLLLSLFLALLVLAGAVGGWNAWLRPANAANAGTLLSASSQMTFQHFLQERRQNKVAAGPQSYKGRPPAVPPPQHSTDYNTLLPSAEPPTMQPITQVLSASFFQGGSGGSPLDLVGSDGRLEIVIVPGTFDVSQATVAGGAPPSGALRLSVSELQGYYVGQSVSLGRYQLQLVDSHGQVLSGVQALQPITLRYHYQPAELTALELDPGRVALTFPDRIAAARKAKTSAAADELLMQNDPTTATLSTQSSLLVGSIIELSSTPQDQSTPTLHLASVQGNSGQLTDSYPLQVSPGPGGFQPQLALSYTSAGPNERHSANSPAGAEGDGWSLSLGFISEETYGSNPGTVWYFLNDVAGVGDRLIPTGSNNLYDTQHISYLKIQQVTSSITNQPCFDVWDKSGTFYEIGCTSSSLQY